MKRVAAQGLEGGRRPGVSVLLWTALMAGVLSAASAQPPPASDPDAQLDSIAQRARPCFACHGREDRITAEGWYPRIAGKPAGYIYHQLLNFRVHRRHNEQMTYMVDRQTDAFLRELADYFAGLKLPYPPPAARALDEGQLLRGRQLLRSGDRVQQLPACSACHGERLTGLAPDIPGLLGLPYDYLVAQFGAWRTGTRRTPEPDCMAEIARNLTDFDIAAVAAALAVQPVPDDAQPAMLARRLPLDCGSVEAPP
jgi:cytochrome c553